jgi:hypothetical protein
VFLSNVPRSINHTEGNVVFRKLVAERVNEYKTLQGKGDRPGTLRLVRAVIAQVHLHGGRFLDKNWKNEVRKLCDIFVERMGFLWFDFVDIYPNGFGLYRSCYCYCCCYCGCWYRHCCFFMNVFVALSRHVIKSLALPSNSHQPTILPFLFSIPSFMHF